MIKQLPSPYGYDNLEYFNTAIRSYETLVPLRLHAKPIGFKWVFKS